MMRKTIILFILLFSINLLNTNIVKTINSRLAPIGLAQPIIDGYPLDWPYHYKLHPSISIDGLLDDWYTEYYPLEKYRIYRNVSTSTDPYNPLYVWDYGNGNKYLYYQGEFIWFDAIGDQRTGYTDREDADITELRVTSNETHLLILLRFSDLGVLGGGVSDPSIAIVIALDVDMNYLNGATLLADGKTSTPNYAPWDYEVLIDLSNPEVSNDKKIYGDGVPVSSGGSPLDIYNATYSDVSTNKSVFIANSAWDDVEIAIAWSDLGVVNQWNISNVRFFVATYISDGYGNSVYDLPSSDFIDVASNTTTDNEVSDGILNYWIDIGFNRVPEPVCYQHMVLDDKGYIQAWSDLTNDERTDYIPNEAFDVDILEVEVWKDIVNNQLYILIHLKGIVIPSGNITPMIALVFDTTPQNESDGTDSWIYAPSGYGYTETQLGGKTQRNATWSFIIWLIPANNKTIIINGTQQVLLPGNQYIAYTHHFIEAAIPLSSIGSLPLTYRLEVLSYAYVNPGSPLSSQFRPREILDLPGTNTYDLVSYQPTWGNSVSQTYSIGGEFYDTDADVTNDYTTGNGDHWIDSYEMIKYAVRIINVTLHHVSYDNDSYIEIGEPAWVTAMLEYYNGTSWVPLVGRSVKFYLIGSVVYLGTNTTNSSGVAILYLGDIARNPNVVTGTYYVLATYDPPLTYSAGGDYAYSVATNYSVISYNIAKRPFIPSLNEPIYTSTILLISVILVILLLKKRYSHNHY